MNKRIISLLAIAIILLVNLTACSPKATPAPTPAPGVEPTVGAEPTEEVPPPPEQVTITYAIWDNNQLAAHEQIIAAFEAEHPEINVEPQVVPWEAYWDKLQTAVAGGEAYDVFWMNGPNFQVYASRGVLLNIQPLIETDSLDMSVYPQSLVDLYTYNGESYGLPKDFDTIALFYNKDLFDAASLAYPDDTWTWDTLASAAQTLTVGDVWGFAATTSDQEGYWNFIYQNGGQVLAPDNRSVLLEEPAACDAIKYLYSFVENGSSPDGATQSSIDPWTQLFPGGKVAMMAAGSWMAKTYAESGLNIDVAPLPQGVQRASIIHGLGNVIWSGSPNRDAAWEFLKFLGGEEAANILAESGTVIPAYQGMQAAWVRSIPTMNLQVFIDALEYSVPYPTTAFGPEWSAKIGEILSEVWIGNIPIADACAQAAAAANEVLQQSE